MMTETTILILCLLGDPTIPAGSCDRAGGFNVDMQEILRYWSKSSYHFAVITNTSPMFSDPFKKLYHNISLYRVPLNPKHLNDQHALDADYDGILETVHKLLSEYQLKPTFIHSYYWLSGRIALHLSRELRIPFIHSIVALSADKKKARSANFCQIQFIYEREFLPYAAAIFAITQEEKNTLLTQYPCDKEKVVVTGRAVDPAFSRFDHDAFGTASQLADKNKPDSLELTNQPDNSPWWYQGAFTYVGRLKHEKGLDTIIRTWYQLIQADGNSVMPLWIVGGYPEAIEDMRHQLLTDCPDLPALEQKLKLCWWGYLSPASMNVLFMRTSVLVAHSQYEAGGRVLIEAMSVGLPVIATPTGFAADLVRDWKNGFLVPYGDQALLMKRMEHFIRQPLLSNSLGLCAKATYDASYRSWDYYKKHKYIYAQCSKKQPNGIDWDGLRQKEFSHNIITDYFAKEQVCTYPYELPSQLEIVRHYGHKLWLSSVGQISSLYECSHHSLLYSVNVQGEKRIIKQVYSRLNSRKLWVRVENMEDAYPCTFLLEQLVICGRSSAVLKPQDLSLQYHCFWLPLKKVINQIDMLSDFYEVLTLIYRFNTDPLLMDLLRDTQPITLETLWTFLLKEESFYEKLLNSYIPDIRDFLPENLSFIPKMGISYGKTFTGHVIQDKDHYLLLPNSGLWKTELGTDGVVYFLELWYSQYVQRKDLSRCRAVLQSICEIYAMDKTRFISWSYALWFLGLKKEFLLGNTTLYNDYSKALKVYSHWIIQSIPQ